MNPNQEPRWTSVPGPDNIVRRELANGLVCQVHEHFSSPSVVINLRIKAGSLAVPRDKAGLAGFVADMMTRGTKARDFQEINETIEAVGASLDFDADWTATGGGGRCLSEDLPLLLDLLADCLLGPTFPPDQMAKVRGEILTSLEQRSHDTRRMSMLRLYETLYQGHPLGVSGLGYMDSILSITQDDLYAFYRDHYHPAGAIMTIVGAVKAEEAIAQVEKHLGGWQGHGERQEPLFPQVTRPQSVVASEIRIPGKTQADLALGTVSLLRKSPDFLAARLANSILGVFGMMGRVGDNVRERQGLAYYAYTSLVAGEVPGPWMAIAGVSPDNIPRAVVAIVDEIRRLQDELVPDQELAENKAHLTGSMPLALETNAGMASTLQAMEVYDLGHDYLERYPAMIEAISAADVQRIARQYLDPEAYVLSVAKPTE